MILFNREQSYDCFNEAIPMLKLHWQEIAYIDEIEPNPRLSTYEQLEKTDRLRTYTARRDGKLIGYAVFFLQPHLHFSQTTFAYCDIIFILKQHRGFGHKFIRWCNDCLKRDGATVILYDVNKRFDYGSVLKRQGFKHTSDGYSLAVREGR